LFKVRFRTDKRLGVLIVKYNNKPLSSYCLSMKEAKARLRLNRLCKRPRALSLCSIL